jgi:Bax protein
MQAHSTAGLGFGLLFLIVVTSILVADGTDVSAFTRPDLAGTPTPRAIEIDNTTELHALFKSLDYHWPPPSHAHVPSLLIKHLPQDLPSITDSDERKSLFLRILLPIVLLENRRIREQRTLAQWLLSEAFPTAGSPEHRWLTKLAKGLRVSGDLHDPAVQARLLRRLDEVPPALALAQGAIESGWGTSRFALEGNSLFGQWTYKADAGLEPSERDPEDSHLVARFPDLRTSVRAYLRNLNTGHAYREFREARAAMRAQGRPLSPTELAGHLRRYSQRGVEYVEELRAIINSSTLAILPAGGTPRQQAALASPAGHMVAIIR